MAFGISADLLSNTASCLVNLRPKVSCDLPVSQPIIDFGLLVRRPVLALGTFRRSDIRVEKNRPSQAFMKAAVDSALRVLFGRNIGLLLPTVHPGKRGKR